MSRHLARLAPAIASQLDELQDAINNLGETVGVTLAAKQQEAEQQKVEQQKRASERERTAKELVLEEASPTKCYRAREVARRLSINQQTLWRWVKAGRFPRGVKIGQMTTVWSEAAIAQWLAEQAAKERP